MQVVQGYLTGLCTNNTRTSPRTSGSVAARVQAFEEGQHLNTEFASGLPHERPIVLGRANEGGTVIGRGRRLDTIFASPASRVLQDRTESMRKAVSVNAGAIPYISRPQSQEKEMYFRPFSRVPQPASFVEHSGQKLSVQSLDQPQTQAICSSHLPSHQSDAVTALRTARSNLQSVKEKRKQKIQNPEDHSLTIDELGTLLDDAIETSTKTNTHPTTSLLIPQSKLESLVDSVTVNTEDSGIELSTVQNSSEIVVPLDGHDICDVPLHQQERHETSTDSSMSYSEELPDIKGYVLEETELEVKQLYSPGAAERKAGGVFVTKYRDLTGHPPSSDPARRQIVLHQSSSKHQGVPADKLADLKNAGAESPFDWHWPQTRVNRRSSQPVITSTQHHYEPSSVKQERTVALPAIPKQVKCVTPEERSAHPEAMQQKTDLNRCTNTSGSLLAEYTPTSSPVRILDKQADVQSSMQDAIHAADYGAGEKSPDQKPERPFENSKGSLDFGLLQSYNEVMVSQENKPLSLGSLVETARPSIVESRIRDLLTASKQANLKSNLDRRNIVDQGAVRQSVLIESVGDKNVVDAKRIPQLQLPLGQQAKMMQQAANKSPQTDIEVHPSYNSTMTSDLHKHEAESPSKKEAPIPSTPLRGRSRTVKESLSPHGKPFAIEQRFRLSPSCSPSRHSGGGVLVSVEVRSSPEKNVNGEDEHEVVVRANIQPEDITEDSERSEC